MAEPSHIQRRRIRNGIFGLAAVSLLGLIGLRYWGVDQAAMRIAAISAGLLVTTLFMTYRAMASAVDAGLSAERDANLTDSNNDPSSRALPSRPE
jgi:hypothetical protein